MQGMQGNAGNVGTWCVDSTLRAERSPIWEIEPMQGMYVHGDGNCACTVGVRVHGSEDCSLSAKRSPIQGIVGTFLDP